ncbi:hypothetical protein AYO20_03212 [Fonsecaea nubica]|uniref:NmrA-like domain-containing protein n=1 Tax=Fonsecaea nubica TaxID=856822 RepID=A0A178D818_9EURO|nr:hypothetical protein AYO20_03212 [Fonsecaea nubica]OAL37363.1 hypothetical protein AYO20_03212 [Fonsecaea nubica]
MARILVTDAEGLVGKYVVSELVSKRRAQDTATPTLPGLVGMIVRAGYHSQEALEAAIASNTHPEMVEPVMVDWKDETTFLDALTGVHSLFLLTPFTSAKLSQCRSWIDAAAKAKAVTHEAENKLHVVYAGVHCNDRDEADRVPHETWHLQAENAISEATHVFASSTFLRINFDGYNGTLRPGEIAYFLPADKKYGWIAREDIAAVAAVSLLEPSRHAGRTYPLATEKLSLVDMADIAKDICGFDVGPRRLSSDEFARMALSPLANPDDDPGYVEYIESVAQMFQGLEKGQYPSHTEVFPEVVREICGREPISFRVWLTQSPFRVKLEPS